MAPMVMNQTTHNTEHPLWLGKGRDRKSTCEFRKVQYIQKCKARGNLSEAVVVNDMPFFLQVIDGIPALQEKIELANMTLKPLERFSYLNKEYSFDSLDEIKKYIERAKNESMDSLFKIVKTIWKKYNDADNDHIVLCAADTIFTYFQDRLGMTHYLLFVGDNNTGKSNNLALLSQLGYRPLLDTCTTAANIYHFLGSIEEGQGIILEDEADDIDRNNEKMRIYKVGYRSGTKVSRMNGSFDQKQRGYWNFCFKAFSAEKQPDNNRAKGFNERTFVIHCSTGNPQFDITEVINPAGDVKYSKLLEELTDIRKLLLVYRLVNYNEAIPDVELNIKNRDKQLCKPLIRLFQDSNTVTEITKTLSRFLSEKIERKRNTLDARLYGLVKDLADKVGNKLNNKVIWESVRENIPGTEIPGKQQSYESEEFGIISKTKVTKILVDIFGAEQKSDGENRYLLIDKETLKKLSSNYDFKEIQILWSVRNIKDNSTDTFDSYYASKTQEPVIDMAKG
jgi:hypothetical protein